MSTGQSLAEWLHDRPLQLLGAMQLKLTALATADIKDVDELRGHLVALKDLTGSVIGDLNEVIRKLADAGCAELGQHPRTDLFARLQQLSAAFRSSAGIDCRFAVLPEHTHFDTLVSEVAYRAVAELLTNVRKHARAKNAELSSTLLEDGSTILTVRDDGIGLRADRSKAPLETGGFGLWSIDLRLREIGAFMEIESGSGVCASLVFPPELGRPN
jgi:two-component system sensor histidine kinase DegS